MSEATVEVDRSDPVRRRVVARRIHSETVPADAPVDDVVREVLAAYAAGTDPADR